MRRKSNQPRKCKCAACHSLDVLITSGFDGRRKWICQNCGNHWTNGKRPNEGYKGDRRNEKA